MPSAFAVGQIVSYRGQNRLWWDEHLRVLEVSRNSSGIEVVRAGCDLGESWFLPAALVPVSQRCLCDTCCQRPAGASR